MMSVKKGLVGFFAVVLALIVGTANAALVTTQSASAPTDNVVISQTAGAYSSPFRWERPAGTDRNPRDLGQSFLVGAGGLVLDKISVNIATLASSAYDGGSVTMDIFTLTDGSDFTPDSNVATESGTLPAGMKSSFDGGDTYLTFDVTDVTLSAGQQYGFLLMHGAQQSIGDNMLLESQANSAYTDGIGIVREQRGTGGDNYMEATVWVGSSQPADVQFYLQEVPEPSAFFLAAVGLLGVAAGGRRRRCRI